MFVVEWLSKGGEGKRDMPGVVASCGRVRVGSARVAAGARRTRVRALRV